MGVSRHRRVFRIVVFSMLVTSISSTGARAQQDGDGIDNQPDNPGTGAYPALKEEDPSLPDQVVYRPRDLDAMGGMKLGVVAWGNGGCSFDGASSRRDGGGQGGIGGHR